MELLNIRFSYLCRATHQNEEGKSPIVLRIIYRGERRDIFTGLYCFKKDWDAQNSIIDRGSKNAASLNQNMVLILRKANHAFDELKFSGAAFTITELVDKIKGKENKPVLLIDFLEEGNQKILKRIGVNITKITYYKYKRSLLYMKEFLQCEYKEKNFSLQRVTTEFIEGYYQYMRNEKNLKHNSACKHLSCIKTMISPLVRSAVIKPDPFYGLPFKEKPVFREHLTQNEIDKIAALILGDPDMERKRDIFLFACYTGLAYIDLRQLNNTHLIKEFNNSWYIRKSRQKTGQDSIIPLLPAATRILIKYSLTGNVADFNWYISSNQKMNQGLKYIGKKAGISKDLHMHLARHTFATTVTLSNGVPIETVSKMLGHASIKQTQHYAKVIPLKIKSDMEKICNLYK
jgi:site-specific recombinase XerD